MADGISITSQGMGDAAIGFIDLDISQNPVLAAWDIAAQIPIISTAINFSFPIEVEVAGVKGKNLATLIGNNYDINREVSFTNSTGQSLATLTAQLHIRLLDPNNLSITGTATGAGDLSSAQIVGIVPFQKQVRPTGPGLISGEMSIPYVTSLNSVLSANLTSLYSFDPNFNLPFDEVRHIEISLDRPDSGKLHAVYSNLTVAPVPEPATASLLLMGIASIAFAKKMRSRKD